MEACLAQFRCQYDVVGSLPLELVLQIVKYLNPEDIVRSRRVRMTHFCFKCPDGQNILTRGLGLKTMALYLLVRYNYQVLFAPNPCLPEHRWHG